MLRKLSPFEERVWNYIKDRKTPVTIKQIAKYFIVSDSRAGKALNEIMLARMATLTYVGTVKHYKPK